MCDSNELENEVEWRDNEIADLEHDKDNLEFELKELKEWRPMESAPKDGTRILGYGRASIPATGDVESSAQTYIVRWETGLTYGDKAGAWINDDGYYDLHVEPFAWYPIPTPPDDLDVEHLTRGCATKIENLKNATESDPKTISALAKQLGLSPHNLLAKLKERKVIA